MRSSFARLLQSHARFLQSCYVSDEPGKPGKPEITDYDNTMVKLKWEKPEKDGGRPILHYVVEQKDKFSDWTEVWLELAARRNVGSYLLIMLDTVNDDGA